MNSRDYIYHAWFDIKSRCCNEKCKAYKWYGGRGISMHPAWMEDVNVFRKDVGERPTPEHSLDRIDNNGNYEPGNVRWATRAEQANNRSTNIRVTHAGKTMTLKQWAEHLGWKYGLIASRWKKGLRGDALFAERKYAERNADVVFNGKAMPLKQWAKEMGVSYYTLVWRLKNGKDLL